MPVTDAGRKPSWLSGIAIFRPLAIHVRAFFLVPATEQIATLRQDLDTLVASLQRMESSVQAMEQNMQRLEENAKKVQSDVSAMVQTTAAVLNSLSISHEPR
jgi:uncharacterized protein YoxC